MLLIRSPAANARIPTEGEQTIFGNQHALDGTLQQKHYNASWTLLVAVCLLDSLSVSKITQSYGRILMKFGE